MGPLGAVAHRPARAGPAGIGEAGLGATSDDETQSGGLLPEWLEFIERHVKPELNQKNF